MLNLSYLLTKFEATFVTLFMLLFFHLRDNLLIGLINLFSTKINGTPGKSSFRAQPKPTQTPSELNIRLGLMLCCEVI